MPLFNRPSHLLALLFVLISIKSSLQYKYRGTVIRNFSSILEEDEDLPKTHICGLDLSSRIERCSTAAKSSDCSDYGTKILLGRPGDPFTYEFEYVNPKYGIKREKKWAVRCPSRPVIFLTAGEDDEHYEVMILKQDRNAGLIWPVFPSSTMVTFPN